MTRTEGVAGVAIMLGVWVVGAIAAQDAQDRQPAATEQVAGPVLPATQLDINAVRVAQLEQQVVDMRAQLLRKDIELSTCRATVDSVTLSDRARELVDDFKRIYGGEWVWSPEQNRPIRPKDKEPPK